MLCQMSGTLTFVIIPAQPANQKDEKSQQAYCDGEWTQTLPGLIPSLALQQHRLALQKQKQDQEAREQQQQSPRRKASDASLH